MERESAGVISKGNVEKKRKLFDIQSTENDEQNDANVKSITNSKR